MCSYIWSSRISCDCKKSGRTLNPPFIYVYIYIITWSRGRKCWVQEEGGREGGAGGSCMLADLLWHVVVKICIDMRENHMNMEEIFFKKKLSGMMLLEVWSCAVEDWLMYVRRATKWKCHMPWCSSNSSSSSRQPVQYNLWFDICISFNLCTSMFCLGHDQASWPLL